jgi:dipeptidyl aminopeptidase/acylaminoacyl peptidase
VDRRHFLSLAGTLSVTSSWALRADAQSLQPGVEDFFKHLQHTGVRVAPGGQALAAIVPVNGRRNLAVIDLKEKKGNILTAFKESDVAAFWWVNEKRIAYALTDLQIELGEIAQGGLYAVDIDGKAAKELSAPIGLRETDNFVRIRRSEFLATFTPPAGDDILVISNDRDLEHPDVYRMNTRTARKELLTLKTPGRTIGWTLDRHGVPRAAITDENDARVAIHLRDSADAPWRKLAEFHIWTEPDKAFQPVTFDYDGSLLVLARSNDKQALFRYDAKENRVGEKLIAHAEYDVGSQLIFDPLKKKLVGIEIQAERPEFVWFDQDWANWHAMLSKALPNAVNTISRSADAQRILVRSYSDRDPGSWYLLDTEKRQLEQLVSAAPWIKPQAMAERKFVRYKARDGLSIPAYLTLPPGKPAKGLPLVVLVHGGPYVRGEVWGFDPEAEFLASRGYAVLQPDFRGSLGYGWKHYAAGWKQWGMTMQDDLNDGAMSLVEQGIVDRSRMALMGGSYGGYAVMMGLARDPDVWKCGVNVVGVTDLTLLTTATWSDTIQFYKNAPAYFEVHIGDPSADKERFRRTSPLQNADKIKKPVLMAYGGLDIRVVPEHGSRMKRALDNNNVPNEYVVYPKEGHGFRLEENSFDFYKKVEAFLAKNL